MTEEQLQQLIRDKDISPGFLDESYPRQFSNYLITSSGGLTHSVSHEIHDIVEACYYQHLNNLYCHQCITRSFKHVIDDRLNYYPQSKERQIKLLEDLLEEKARDKDAMQLNEHSVSFAKFCLQDAYSNVLGAIESDAENMWFWKIYDDHGLQLLEILKYDIFKGRKIEFTSDINIEEIARFFEQLGEEVFEEVFKNILILKKIEYLKQRIIDIQKKEETVPDILLKKKKKEIYTELKYIFWDEKLSSPAIKLLEEVMEDYNITQIKRFIADNKIAKTWYLALVKNNWLKIKHETDVVAQLLMKHFNKKVVCERTLRPDKIENEIILGFQEIAD